MQDRILNTIREHNLIKAKDNIVVGVSGGPDSMALLYLLLHAKKYIDFNIIVAHINHGVRGDDALGDEMFVEKKSHELGLGFHSIRADMVDYANKHKISQEEAGREIRYGFFREVLKSYGGGSIAVAHNMNDQAETLLMRIIRGTGIDGLNGMDYKSEDIIRPILDITRDDIENYIEENKIETVLDKTNLMPIYTRNKIRLELIPYIEENFNPNLIKSLWRLSQTSQKDTLFLQRYTKEEYERILISEDEDRIVIDRDGFKGLEEAIQYRIVILMLTMLLKVFQGFGEQHISLATELFNRGDTGKVLHLPNDTLVKVDYDRLIVEKATKKNSKSFVYDLKIGYNHFSDLGYSFNLRLVHIDDVDIDLKNKNIKCFDFDRIKGRLSIRNRKDGDRFTPYGMKGTKKLKDFFIDLKIPREERERIPLILDEENIIWIMDYRINDLYKLTKNTKNVLIIEYTSFKEDKNGKCN